MYSSIIFICDFLGVSLGRRSSTSQQRSTTRGCPFTLLCLCQTTAFYLLSPLQKSPAVRISLSPARCSLSIRLYSSGPGEGFGYVSELSFIDTFKSYFSTYIERNVVSCISKSTQNLLGGVLKLIPPSGLLTKLKVFC